MFWKLKDVLGSTEIRTIFPGRADIAAKVAKDKKTIEKILDGNEKAREEAPSEATEV